MGLQTIDSAELDNVIGGGKIGAAWKLAKAAGRGIRSGYQAVKRAFSPSKPLTNSTNTAQYAKEIGTIGTVGAGGAYVGKKAYDAATGK